MLSRTEVEVMRIFNECLSSSVDGRGRVKVPGIILTPCFHLVRLERNKYEIRVLLNRLGDDFRKSSGGQSFMLASSRLNASPHATEALIVLGIAVGLIELSPRQDWHKLEKGKPIVYVLDEAPS